VGSKGDFILRVHITDIRENIFSANFPSVSGFQCEASEWSPLKSGRVWLRRLNDQVTCLDARSLVACIYGNARPDELVIHPDGDPTGLKIAFSSCPRTSLLCHLIVLSLLV
jgi:hypothetical protein